VVSLLLLPIFTSYLTTSDYGVITMLLTIEAVAKVAFRWGVDTAFMRLYYDCADQPARQRLASTIFFFLLAVNGSLVLASVFAANWLGGLLIGPAAPGAAPHGVLVALTIANTFVAGFYFIPYHMLRIGERSTQFIALTFTRSAGTIVARLILVIWAHLGVLGIVLADTMVTAVFTLILSRWFLPLIRPVFSREVLKEALGFGLPRVPHSVAQQVISVADRYFLKAYGTLSDVGLYSIGASFGLALKLFLSAFESAWTPFFLAAMKEKDPGRIYSTVSTYVVAMLVLLVAGLCALAPAVVALFTTPAFHPAAQVTPWIALGVMFQGLYLVGSIGLVITKRTTRYPISTGLAAAASLIANIILIPKYGMLGAAWANVIAYFTLAAVTSAFSWQVYPIPYEWSRLARIAIAGVLSYLAAEWAAPASLRPVASLLFRSAVIVPTYFAALYVMRFFHPRELRMLIELRQRVLSRAPVAAAAPETTEVEMAGEILDAGPEREIQEGQRAEGKGQR
jgi:O-antigen/teichoic acid export membrane protein